MGSSLSTRLWLVGRPTGLHGITGCFDVGHWAENSERQLPILTQHWNLYQLEVELRAAALIHYTGLQKLNIFYWLRKRERKKEEKKPEGIITTTRTNTSPRMVSHLELYDYYFFHFRLGLIWHFCSLTTFSQKWWWHCIALADYTVHCSDGGKVW